MNSKSSNILHQSMVLNHATGLLESARQCPSPNCDERPENMAIEAIIIHAISLPPGKYDENFVEQFFCNQLDCGKHAYFQEIAEVQVSSHFYIRRNGDLVQFVPVFKRAWHAGVSTCLGRTAVNDFSIGIELEGCDDDGFEEAQYKTLTELTTALLNAIPGLSRENIFGHSDIAPGRKTDPGPGFKWATYRMALLSADARLASGDCRE